MSTTVAPAASAGTRDFLQIFEATWEGFTDPSQVCADPPSEPIELAAAIDRAWMGPGAWPMVRQFSDYAFRRRNEEEAAAKLEGRRMDGGVIWAYWAVLKMREEMRLDITAGRRRRSGEVVI